MKNITEEEGMNKWDEYSNNIKGYTISFFSNYTPKKSKEDIDAGIYEEFIKNGEYNNYLTSDWEYGMPSQYAVLDIDGNGVDELIIYGNEILLFLHIKVIHRRLYQFKQIFMTLEIHHAKRMLYGFVRIWSIHHNIMH